MKNPPCQSAWRVSEAYSVERYQLFSSFLRGASRPKSPRVTALRLKPLCYIPDFLSSRLLGRCLLANNLPTFCVQVSDVRIACVRPVRMAS